MKLFKLKCGNLKSNYEFDNEKYFSDTAKYAEYIIYSNILQNSNIYLLKVNNNTYYEIISNSLFISSDKQTYINDKLGLYFSDKDLFEFNNFKTLLSKIKNLNYKFYITDYFSVCEELNRIDNNLRSRAFNLLLKKSKTFYTK